MNFPQAIAEDDQSVTFQTPSGQPLRLPKDLAANIGWEPQATQRPMFATPEPQPVDPAPAVPAPVQPAPAAQPAPAPVVTAQPVRQGKQPTKGQQAEAAIAQGFDLQEEAIRERQRVQGEADFQAAEHLRLRNEELKRRDEAEAKRVGEENDFLSRERADIAKAAEDASKLTIDRGAYLRNMPGGQKVGLILSTLVAGIGSAMKGQGDKNPAVDILLSSIDKSVADQMAMIDKARGDIAVKRQILGDKVADFGDRRAQEAVLRARIIDAASGQIEELTAKTKSALAKSNGSEALGLLAAARGETMQRAFQWEEGHRLAQRNTSIAGGQLKLARDKFKADEDQRTLDNQFRQDKLEAERGAAAAKGTLISPVTGKAIGRSSFTDEGQRAKDQAALEAGAKFRQKAVEYAKASADAGRSFGGFFGAGKTDQRRNLEAMHAELITLYGKAISGGEVKDTEIERIEKFIPAPRGTFTGGADPADMVRQWTKSLDTEQEMFLRGRGIDPTGYLRDMRTVMEPEAPVATQTSTEQRIARLSSAESTGDAVLALQDLAKSEPSALLGEDVVATAKAAYDKVAADPKATKPQKEKALAGYTAVVQANANEREVLARPKPEPVPRGGAF